MILGVTLLTFFLFHKVGGDPALQLAGKNADADTIATIRHELGLDQSLMKQYADFLKQTFTLNWGESWTTHQKISQMIYSGLGPTLCLTLPAFFITVLLAIALSLLSAYFKDRWPDRVITVVCLGLMSVSFLVYIVFLQKFLAFDLNLFPVFGWDPGWITRWPYLSLSWIIYVIVSVGPKTLLFRTAIVDELQQDYVRTAHAKGLPARVVYGKHILKNAMIPIITLTVAQMPALISGSLLLEAYFGIPGLGGLLIYSIQNSDFPVIKALTVFGALLYIVFNLLTDVLYAVFDPRVELQ